MLVSFTFENWKSYRTATTLSMIADRSRQHNGTLSSSEYYRGLRILPIAAVYGGNAAGKSNLFDALRFVQKFVTLGRQDYADIPVEPFAWADGPDLPSRFSIQILIPQTGENEFCPARSFQKELIYRLDFAVNRRQVCEESLSWYDSQRKNHLLYTRNQEGDISFSPEFKAKIGSEQINLLQIFARGTGPRRLFLTNTAGQQLEVFRHVYDWFRNSLQTADNGIQSPRAAALMSDSEYCARFGRILRSLGTGVEDIRLEPVPEGMITAEIQNQIADFMSHAPDNAMGQMVVNSGLDVAKQIFVLTKQDDNLSIQRIQTYRNGKPFGFERESSGTRRLIEILPIFLDLWMHTDCTWALDEMEREFHTDMTREMLDGFLESCNQHSRTQALINTHDLMLMDQTLFRKDEIYVVERSADGCSHLISLKEYEGIRNDLDLRRSYLDGRFGGRPSIDIAAFEQAIHTGQ